MLWCQYLAYTTDKFAHINSMSMSVPAVTITTLLNTYINRFLWTFHLDLVYNIYLLSNFARNIKSWKCEKRTTLIRLCWFKQRFQQSIAHIKNG